MPKGYRHLTYTQRCQVSVLLKSGKSLRGIARLLKVAPSTVSREVKRNSGKRGYRHKQAQHKASTRRQSASSKPRTFVPDLRYMVDYLLSAQQWSPEQISGWLSMRGGPKISHERIYQSLSLPCFETSDTIHIWTPIRLSVGFCILTLKSGVLKFFYSRFLPLPGIYTIIWTQSFGMTRHGKTAFIVEQCKKDKLQPPFIKVCSKSNSNCGSCRKCCMTMINLLGLGERLSDYGYYLSPKKAVENTIKYLQVRMGHFDAWNFKEIQLRLKAQCDTQSHSLLKPFLSYDMSKLRIYDRNAANVGSWEFVKHFNPRITVPQDLKAELLNIKV